MSETLTPTAPDRRYTCRRVRGEDQLVGAREQLDEDAGPSGSVRRPSAARPSQLGLDSNLRPPEKPDGRARRAQHWRKLPKTRVRINSSVLEDTPAGLGVKRREAAERAFIRAHVHADHPVVGCALGG